MMFFTVLLSCFLFVYNGYCLNNGHKTAQCELSKDVMVQFHGWKFSDIRNECLASQSRYFCAFQVPPPFEHEIVSLSFPPNAEKPWWQRYHTISWSLMQTDSGTKEEFWNMVKDCNDNNIRIYVDFEVNNVGDSAKKGYGSAGGYYDGGTHQYPHISGQSNFHLENSSPPNGCPTASGRIEDLSNVTQIRYCERISVPYSSMTSPAPALNDLKTNSANVQNSIEAQMNLLLAGDGTAARGVAGFRLAHARWVDPAMLRNIINKINNITIPGIPVTEPLIYSEVYPDSTISETEYYDFGQVEETRAGPLLSQIITKKHSTYNLANLTLWGDQMGLMATQDAIVFIDDPASQRGWPYLTDLKYTLKFDDVRNYQTANAFMLAHPYGYPRVHSSYSWNQFTVNDSGIVKDANDYMGPPRNSEGNVEDVVVTGDGYNCTGDWNCEHRWLAIIGLARFRNLMKQAGADSVNNYWTNGYEQIAFSRGSAGFFVINNEASQNLVANIYTSMSPGTYCDLATGQDPTSDPCDGRTVIVDASGRAAIDISAGHDVPFIAIANL